MLQDKEDPRATIVETGIDYLTATRPADAGGDALIDLARSCGQVAKRSGNALSEWAFRGYVGYSCGPVQWGERDDGAILRVSGAYADHWFPDVADLSARFTRVDVQVTALCDPADDAVARDAYERATFAAHHAPGNREVTLWTNRHDGQCCYIGSRTSEVYLRLYDKGAQRKMDGAGRFWRYEAELKGNAASEIAAWLYRQKSRRLAGVGFVHDLFLSKGPLPVFDPPSDPAPGDPPPKLPPPRPRDSDVMRWESWLSSCIRPVVRNMLELGEHAAVERALHCHLGPALQVDDRGEFVAGG